MNTRITGWAFLIAFCFVGLGATHANSQCLSVGQNLSGDIRFWVNRCSYKVYVIWRDEGSCDITNYKKKFSCSTGVPPSGKSTGHLRGYVEWHECKAPARPVERGFGTVGCVGFK